MSANSAESANASNDYVKEVEAALNPHKTEFETALSAADRTKTYISDPMSREPITLTLAEIGRALGYAHFPDDAEHVRVMKKTAQMWARGIDAKAVLDVEDLGEPELQVKLSFLV